MDAERFDEFAGLLASGGDRRRALGVLVGGAFAWLGPTPAGAGGRKKKRRCRGGRRRCAGRCVDLRTSRAHCGACRGSACAAGAGCVDGVCARTCAGSFECPPECGCLTAVQGGRPATNACGVVVVGCEDVTRCNDNAGCPAGQLCALGCPAGDTIGVCTVPCQ